MKDSKEFKNLKLTPISSSEKNVFKVSVSADENDADYKYETCVIDASEIQDYLPAIQLLADGEISGWGDQRDDDGFSDEIEDKLYDLIPSSEHGVHSVCLDGFIYLDENGTTFNVSIQG